MSVGLAVEDPARASLICMIIVPGPNARVQGIGWQVWGVRRTRRPVERIDGLRTIRCSTSLLTAMIRVRDERADRLAAAGAVVVFADSDELGSLGTAFEGVETASFCIPVTAGIVPAAPASSPAHPSSGTG